MADGSLATTVISTVGALLGALGGIGLTQGVTARREARQAERQRDHEREQARDQSYADLLGSARQLRLQIEVAARCWWRDMDARLSAIEEQAAAVNRHASLAALLAPRAVAEAGRALAEEARCLVGVAVQLTSMSYDDDEFRGGEMREKPDFAAFDACVKAFDSEAAGDVGR